jgi:SAM-dependent methyltransferase
VALEHLLTFGVDPYSRPDLYDLEYEDYDEDLVHYLSLSRGRRSVLELGCGTGRLTLPIARGGDRVLGVDRSEPMIGRLHEQLRAEPTVVQDRVRTRVGDFRDLELQERFPLVLLPFNAVHHCESDDEVRSVFAGVRRVLAPGGLFALDAYLPDLELYDRPRGERHEFQTFRDRATGADLLSWEESWWEPERRVHHVVYVYVDQDRGGESRLHLQLHMRELDEWEDLLAEAGFEVISAASDFVGGALTPSALKWVVVLRAR